MLLLLLYSIGPLECSFISYFMPRLSFSSLDCSACANVLLLGFLHCYSELDDGFWHRYEVLGLQAAKRRLKIPSLGTSPSEIFSFYSSRVFHRPFCPLTRQIRNPAVITSSSSQFHNKNNSLRCTQKAVQQCPLSLLSFSSFLAF